MQTALKKTYLDFSLSSLQKSDLHVTGIQNEEHHSLQHVRLCDCWSHWNCIKSCK